MSGLTELLDVRRGVTALMGGGGKTTLMYRLARLLRDRGTVIVSTSTKIRPPEDHPLLTAPDPERIRQALAARGVICVGSFSTEGKLSAPALSFETLETLADYVLVEADGSRGLPLKAHADHEPVIPECAAQTILVVGADGFGRPIETVCHRPELWCRRCGAAPTDAVTPELAARVLLTEGWGDRVFVNKVETPERLRAAQTLAKLLPLPVTAGSLWREEYLCLS